MYLWMVSLDVCGDLLAAAGKAGRASIFGLGNLFGGTELV